MCGSTHSAGVLSQTVTLTGIALIDNNGVRKADVFFGSGRLLGTLTTSTAGASTKSTVCGPLDTVTSFFLCSRPGIYINCVLKALCPALIMETPLGLRLLYVTLTAMVLQILRPDSLKCCQLQILHAPTAKMLLLNAERIANEEECV